MLEHVWTWLWRRSLIYDFSSMTPFSLWVYKSWKSWIFPAYDTVNDLKNSFRHVASANVPNYSLFCLCHHKYPLRVKSHARPPYFSSFCPLLVSNHKKMGKKDENLAHLGKQIFSHARLHTVRWPHNLCDAAIRQVILFTRLRSTNNVFCNDFWKVFIPFVHCHMKISFAQ